MRLSTPELLLIFGIIVLLFGVGRISKIAGELGKGIKAFRTGVTADDVPVEDVKLAETTEE